MGRRLLRRLQFLRLSGGSGGLVSANPSRIITTLGTIRCKIPEVRRRLRSRLGAEGATLFTHNNTAAAMTWWEPRGRRWRLWKVLPPPRFLLQILPLLPAH